MNRSARVLPAVLAGLCIGLSLYTFRYAEGLSYFSKDPKACVNCHIMQPPFDSWQKASHHGNATCVDCHLPHGFIGKYIAKADNGYRHSKGFTFQDFHEPLMINKRNSEILQGNCLRCHDDMVHDLVASARSAKAGPDALQCVHCHAGVGHGEKTGMGRFEQAKTAQGEAKR